MLIIKKPRYILFSLSVFISSWIINTYFYPCKDINGGVDGVYKINDNISVGGVISIKGQNVLLATKEKYGFNDVIHISGKIEDPINTSDFDYVGYLKQKNIFHIIKWPKIKLIKKSLDLRTTFLNYLNSGPSEYKKVSPLILLGAKNLANKELFGISLKMSIVHLFVISGFHISLFYVIIEKILLKLKVNKIYSKYISLIPIAIYLVLLNFPISATRAGMLVFIQCC